MTTNKKQKNKAPEDENAAEETLSKTVIKREMLALQKLGEELMQLTPAQLASLSLPENLENAINDAKSMTKRRALYRQRQYIGRVMRDVDAEPIIVALDALRHPEKQSNARFHRVEDWRNRLVQSDGQLATEFINAFPSVDRQPLLQKIRAACQEARTGKPAGGGLALFRFIDDVVESVEPDEPST